MGSNYDRVSQEEVDRVKKLASEGRSAREIGKDIGRTRNSVIGLIHRHVRAAPVAPAPLNRKRVHVAGSSLYDEPARPRRFSWEDEQ